MTGRDKETGVGLSDQSIKNNVRNRIDHMSRIDLTRFDAAFDFPDCRYVHQILVQSHGIEQY